MRNYKRYTILVYLSTFCSIIQDDIKSGVYLCDVDGPSIGYSHNEV